MAFEPWSYDDGQHYPGSWISLILLLAPSVLFNFATFLLLSLSPQLTRSSSSLLVRILCLEDAVYSLCCLVSCLLNFHHTGIYGQHVGCDIQATYMLFFQLCTGYTLCCVAYNSERKVAGKRGLTQRQVWLTHAVIWSVAAVITVLSVFVVQPARVYPSGTFCLVAINELGPALLFWLPGLVVILAVITHRYTLLYRCISQRSTLLADQYAKSPAAAAAQLRQIAAAKRMAAIVAIFLLSNLPFALLGLYELCSRQDAPAIVTIAGAWLIHFGSMCNPIIYVWLNGRIRATLSDAAHRLLQSAATVSPVLVIRQHLAMSVSPLSGSSTPMAEKGCVPASSPSMQSCINNTPTHTQTTLTVVSQQPPVQVSPSLGGTTLSVPPHNSSDPSSPQQPSRNNRRASAITLVVEGGHTRPGSSALAVREGVTGFAHICGSVRQPTAEMDPLSALNALPSPSESPSERGETNR